MLLGQVPWLRISNLQSSTKISTKSAFETDSCHVFACIPEGLLVYPGNRKRWNMKWYDKWGDLPNLNMSLFFKVTNLEIPNSKGSKGVFPIVSTKRFPTFLPNDTPIAGQPPSAGAVASMAWTSSPKLRSSWRKGASSSDDSLSEGRYKKKTGFNTKTNRCLMFNGKFVCIVSLRHLIFIMCSRDLYGNTRHRNQSLSRFIKLRESIDFHTLRAWHGVRLILWSSYWNPELPFNPSRSYICRCSSSSSSNNNSRGGGGNNNNNSSSSSIKVIAMIIIAINHSPNFPNLNHPKHLNVQTNHN